MFTLNCKGRLLVIDRPLVMGIMNVTPDSFYEQSRVRDKQALLQQAGQMLEEGAAILDIGGQSTRPGSIQVGIEDELRRVIPAIESVKRSWPHAIISVDTFYARVAREAVAAGASIINDISAGSMDPDMISAVAALGVPYVLMHMKGVPSTMQQEAHYENLTREVLDFFVERMGILKKAGINDIILDPGFGFGKTIRHNFELLRNLALLRIAERPVLIGLSRKSTVYRTLDTTAEHALNGTTVLHTIGLLNGASILRVHDVKEAVEAIRLVTALQQEE